MTEEQPKAPSGPGPGDVDPEQLRQFHEFQRFQEFQRYQQATGGAPPPGAVPPPPGRTSFWRALFGSKLLRRLLYLAVFLIAAGLTYDHYFGGDDPSDVAVDSGGSQGNVVTGTSPVELVRNVYRDVGFGNPDACKLFAEDGGRERFARAFDAPDCAAAVASLKARVVNVGLYEQLEFPNALYGTPTTDVVEVSSCQMTVKGGPALGRFVTRKQSNGTWIIADYEAEPTCPVG